ncbi:uncharacterized protein FFB20_14676 [Fusarium fujikuroi]|nr:uncharacterized protein FFC1_02768 [Fusarium fujikuroi]SCN86388.1 uncharacterized protein FFE2_05941 [Fusarium fujikuroi]SCN92617.1 uncharacterized protein FFM5_05387 [Fusarium fujikuroi]SCO15083.1 uncharacterized protein FFB20_14676 [Fusarium fujikuroi]SCO31536.1 uncharacterized protein FFNC_02228 [Fusarium fujikuroi]
MLRVRDNNTPQKYLHVPKSRLLFHFPTSSYTTEYSRVASSNYTAYSETLKSCSGYDELV